MYDLCRFSLCSDSAEPPVRKQRVDLTREKAAAASTPREKERTVPESQEIPTGEPILPPPPASARLPFARLLHASKTTGDSPEAEGEKESSDSLLKKIIASPPSFECYHGEQLEDDPQLIAGNMKKFQVVVREFTKFSMVSTVVEYFFSLCRIFL